MARLFIPDYYTDCLECIDWQKFKDQGISHVFLDIDNTLELHGATVAGERTHKICKQIEMAGLEFSILSNAKSSRAQKFCAPYNFPYLGQAAKPLTFQVKRYMRFLGLTPREVLVVGDQVFTDLWCARFLGAPVLLVESLGGDEKGFLKFKRLIESALSKLGQNPKKAKRAPLQETV